MIKFAADKLIIEIETTDPREFLYELQTHIIRLLQLRDESQDTDRIETYYALRLLQELLLAPRDY